MAIQHALPFTVPGAAPTVLADIAPWHLTRARAEDAGPGTQGGREMSADLQHYLEPEPLTIPWWHYPGARSWLALQRGMTPARVEALVALAGRTDAVTLAEVAARYSMRPDRLLRWQALAESAIRRLTGQMMEDVVLPSRRQTVLALKERQALSIGMLAARAGVAPATVFRAVHGRPIRPGNKQRIAAALSARPEAIKWEQVQ